MYIKSFTEINFTGKPTHGKGLAISNVTPSELDMLQRACGSLVHGMRSAYSLESRAYILQIWWLVEII
jgi:hypothetical protein